MNANPYAPPTAMVTDVLPVEHVESEPPFFAVSLPKLAIMSLCTFSVYELYWFYRHWRRIAERERAVISPVGRAIFTVIYCHSLFARVRDYTGRDDGMLSLRQYDDDRNASLQVGWTLRAGPLAAGWIIVTLMQRLPDPYGFLALFSFVFLLPVQAYANRLNTTSSPSHNRNARFSAWNWLAVAAGGLLLLASVADALGAE